MILASKSGVSSAIKLGTAHPFELAGMGLGPYQFVTLHDIREAREHAMQHLGGTHAAQHPDLKAGLGTCACCGIAINLVCVIEDGSGDRWGVGSSCVEKSGLPHLGDRVRIMRAQRRRSREAAAQGLARQRKNELWLAAPSVSRDAQPGETNGSMRNRQHQERLEADAATAAQRIVREARWGGVIETMKETKNSFLSEMAILLGERPLTERQADCSAAHFHRRGTAQHAKLSNEMSQ